MNKPEDYASLNTYQGKDAKTVLHRFLGQLTWNNNEQILEFGSGPGNVTSSILLPALPKDAKLTGLDTSIEMVTFANKAFANDRLSFKRVDVSTDFTSSGEWKKDEFDKIFSFYCLNFIHDQEQTARNMNYLLKKGGFVTLLFCGSHPFYEVYEVMAPQPKWSPYLTNLEDIVAIYQHEEDASSLYRKVLENAGFEVMECKSEIFFYQYPTLKDLMKMYAAVNPYSDSIPKALHQEYLDTVQNILLEKKRIEVTPSGATNIYYKNIVAFARKK